MFRSAAARRQVITSRRRRGGGGGACELLLLVPSALWTTQTQQRRATTTPLLLLLPRSQRSLLQHQQQQPVCSTTPPRLFSTNVTAASSSFSTTASSNADAQVASSCDSAIFREGGGPNNTVQNLQQQQHQQRNQQHHHYVPRKSSVVEERVAARQLRPMELLTQHVLDQASFKTVRIEKNQLRSLYLYWLSKPVRDLCDKQKCPERPLQAADQLLHWMMHQFDHVATLESDKRTMAATIEYVLRNTNRDESVNAGVCRLMSLFLQPLQGTKATLRMHPDAERRTDATAVQHVASLLAATRVYDIMQRLHADTDSFPHLQPDAQSVQSTLNLHGKRCKFLAFLGPPPRTEGAHSPRIRRGVRWSDPDTVQALGGCTTARDCVRAAQTVMASTTTLHQQQQQQQSQQPQPQLMPRPIMIHYSMLMSMMSYAAGMEAGMADDALAVLQGLEADPTLSFSLSSSLYNPVLLAYVKEVEAFTKKKKWAQRLESKQKCEALWARIRQCDDPAVSADPISYSIMMKLYQDLDQTETAQELLDLMEAAATTTKTSSVVDSANTPIPAPTLMHYNTVLHAYAKSTLADSGERGMSLLRRMEDQTTATGQPHSLVPRPDRISYTSALDALLRGQNFDDMMERMQAVLERFEANEDVRRRPDAVTYNVLFHTLFRRIREQSDGAARLRLAETMEDLLRRLKKHSPHFRVVAGPRVFRYYNDCFRAWAYTNSPVSAERAMRLLLEMEEDSGTGGSFPSARPNGTTYQFVLATISRIHSVAAVQAAVAVLEKMEKSGVPVTVTALNTFLGMLLNCRFEGSIEESDDAFVETIMQRFRANTSRDDGFTAGWVFEGIFTNLNKELDTHKKDIAARRIEKLFRALLLEPEHFRLTEGQTMTVYYNKCLKAWAFARSHESTANALRILREMEEKCSTQSVNNERVDDITSCQPDAKTYDYILTCLSRAPDAISVQTARSIFRTMDINGTPIVLSVLNRFIRVLVKSGVDGCLQESEMILKGVEADYFAGRDSLCPNESTYAVLVDGYKRSTEGLRDAERILQHMRDLAEKTGKTALLPSVEMYKDLIKLWSSSVAPDAMERVDDLFHRMAELSKPNCADYAALQAAWGRSKRPDAPQRVESILVRMQEDYEKAKNPMARPTVENFSFVIKTWATSKQDGSAERADLILRRLEDLCFSDRETYKDLTPTTICYENALLGWTFSNSPEAGDRALALLDRMKQAQSVAQEAASINQACYHHAIHAVGNSHVVNKATKCYEIVEEMRTSYETGQNRYSRPTHESFRSVLSACATCTGSVDEQEAAMQVTMKAMRDYLQFAHPAPRKDVYLQFLYSVFRLFPAGEARDEAVRGIFAGDMGRFKCPAAILEAPTMRDALAKTVSPAVFGFIVVRCGRQNTMLTRLIKNRIEKSS